MHATQRERLIVELLASRGFASFREIESRLDASPATIRRDLDRLAGQKLLLRVRGGAQCMEQTERPELRPRMDASMHHQDSAPDRAKKAAIGKAAAALCSVGEGVMIDGGSTTLEMCDHLAGLNLQVLTSSLTIADALLSQSGTRVLLPAGVVLRDQNVILSAAGEENMPRFHAPKLFRGASAIGAQGVMQADVVLVAAEQRLIERASQIIVLVESGKFRGPSGHVVCGLSEIDTVITDADVSDTDRLMLTEHGVHLIIAR